MTSALLSVEGLTKHFPVRGGGLLRAVDGVDFQVRPGEALGLVGESGCGKTTTGRMLVRLLEPTAGRIVFEGRDVTHLRRSALRPLRQQPQMIFQDPYGSLNPRHTVGRIVAMPMQVNGIRPPGGLKNRVRELLETVGLNPSQPRALQPLSTRILRWATATGRYRPGSGAAPEAHRGGRTGVRA